MIFANGRAPAVQMHKLACRSISVCTLLCDVARQSLTLCCLRLYVFLSIFSGAHVIAGYKDGITRVWDMKTNKATEVKGETGTQFLLYAVLMAAEPVP